MDEFDFSQTISEDLLDYSRSLRFSEKAIEHDQMERATEYSKEAKLLKSIYNKMLKIPNMDKDTMDELWSIIDDHIERNQRTMDSW